jgi:peptidoglycan/xylan/chitin deacetylase (PgdA/CDA1 family)
MTEYLKEKNIPATFFLLCKHINSKSISRYSNALFSIGSHSYDHKNLDKYKSHHVDKDFQKCDEIFKKNIIPYSLMRPAYGIVNEDIVRNLKHY